MTLQHQKQNGELSLPEQLDGGGLKGVGVNWRRGGGWRGDLGVVGPSCSVPRNKNANLANSPVDRLYGKQVRVPRSTCVPSIYQLAFFLF